MVKPLDKIIAAIQRLGAAPFSNGEILAIEVGMEQVFAALVRRQGQKYQVIEFVSMDRRNPGEDLPDAEDIRQITLRLNYQGRALVLITPLARMVQLGISAARAKKLRPYQLAESLRWEVEPYTGISGMNALVGVEKGVVETDEVLLALEGEQDVDVNVAVIERNVYLALRQICKRADLNLTRVYSAEGCFYVPVTNDGDVCAVFDIGQDLSNFVLLRGGTPKQISAYPIGRESMREIVNGEAAEDIEASLRYILDQVPPHTPLIITGCGTLDAEIVAWLDRECQSGAQALEIRPEHKLSEAVHDGLNAIYATVVGAAMRELTGGGRRRLGLSNDIPLTIRLRDSAYVMPLIVAAFLALALFGHYEWMVLKTSRYDKRISDLNVKLQVNQQQKSQYEKYEKRSTELRREILLTEKRISFVEGGSDDHVARLIQVLHGLTLLPKYMILEKVSQDGGDFMLSGIAERPEVVSQFAVAIQDQSWCKTITIEGLEYDNEGFLFSLRLDMNDAQTDKT